MLVVDVWWGWLDARFRGWLKTNYPWVRLIFVPASCTPVGQPMDAGIIAIIKVLDPLPSPIYTAPLPRYAYVCMYVCMYSSYMC